MEILSLVIDTINHYLSPILVVGLLGAGVFLTLRLGFIQIRRLGHGFAVTSGRYDDPDEPGDETNLNGGGCSIGVFTPLAGLLVLPLLFMFKK